MSTALYSAFGTYTSGYRTCFCSSHSCRSLHPILCICDAFYILDLYACFYIPTRLLPYPRNGDPCGLCLTPALLLMLVPSAGTHQAAHYLLLTLCRHRVHAPFGRRARWTGGCRDGDIHHVLRSPGQRWARLTHHMPLASHCTHIARRYLSSILSTTG